jgi:hypothetical protein
MISKSTKAKRRKNAKKLIALSRVRLVRIIRKEDFWLFIMSNDNEAETEYVEIYGQKKALKFTANHACSFHLKFPWNKILN